MKTIGEYYQEKVLSKKGLREVELPQYNGESRIEKDLFGWKLYSGKNFIECSSQEEARYLKVFLDSGLSEIKIPKDVEYLMSILPELERLKSRIDEILNSYLESIFDRKAREQLKHEVYMEVTK